MLVGEAHRLLRALFKPGYRYSKCGVQLSHIQPESTPDQLDLFGLGTTARQTNSQTLMETMDQINRRFPKSIAIAATGFDKTWQARAERLSPRYTMDWLDLPLVK